MRRVTAGAKVFMRRVTAGAKVFMRRVTAGATPSELSRTILKI
ncbi:hypothetical protein [Enterococcus sp. BWB1-3]|nr:hypothetical protein [Enterococcus sp. BWB1-3]